MCNTLFGMLLQPVLSYEMSASWLIITQKYLFWIGAIEYYTTITRKNKLDFV